MFTYDVEHGSQCLNFFFCKIIGLKNAINKGSYVAITCRLKNETITSCQISFYLLWRICDVCGRR